jgi:DNA-binding GntR family transcriptional regulator
LYTKIKPLQTQPTEKRNATPARERTYEFLKERLLSGQFKPGERLTEEHLATELGVSRTPVREALHKLEREGLVKPLETRGFCVPSDSIEEMEELFEIRSILEGYALRCVCISITDENLAYLQSFIDKAAEAFNQKEIDKIFHINTKFHDTLHSLVSHKPRLHNLMADMRKYVLRYRKNTLYHLAGTERAIEGHRKIMLALKLKDPDLCERIMREHIRESKEDAVQATFEET